MVNRQNTENKFHVLVLAGGWVLVPGRWDGEADVWIRNGLIEAVVSPDVPPPQMAECLDVTGMLVLPGLIDLHVHLREPGFEYKETIATGTAAAVAGGFASICCMPNTKPVNDEPPVTQLIKMKSGAADRANVYPIGAITKGSAGRELTDFRALKEAGCVAVSDDGRPVMDDQLMRQAMQQASDLDLPVIDHCEDLVLSGCGCINEGPVSRALGVRGIPKCSEFRMIARDIRLAEATGTRSHIAASARRSGWTRCGRRKPRGCRWPLKCVRIISH